MSNENQIDDYYINEDKIQTRNEVIWEELQPFIEKICGDVSDKSRSKIVNPATQTRNKLTSILRRYPPFPNGQIYKLKPKDVWQIYLDYLSLNAQINEYIPYVMDKLEFCAYARISLKYYNEMCDDSNLTEEQRTNEMTLYDIFSAIDADIVNSTMSGAETGAISGNAAKIRTKAKRVSNAVVETDDSSALADSLTEAAKGVLYHAQKLELAQKYRPKISEKN